LPRYDRRPRRASRQPPACSHDPGLALGWRALPRPERLILIGLPGALIVRLWTGTHLALALLRLGWLWVLVQTIHSQALPVPQRLAPEPWPDIPSRLDGDHSPQRPFSYAFM
jgi:hypothetical protein